MLLLVALVIGLLGGVATGGRLGNVANVTIRWPWLVVAALVVREAAVFTPLNRIDGVQYVYVAALAALVAWTAWHASRLRGAWIVALGAAMNLIVVVANGARMPVAQALAGRLADRGHIGQYTVMGPGTNLGWLGDWIGVPGPLGGAYSPGDVVIAIGIAAVAFLATRQGPAAATKLDETSGRIGSYPP
ncbi:MAG TPA: DUF5317 family protein [Candidatus Micrarchaeaceae archaeon]|nr:DUF5317 family protein [Candidatus Micrarchaeaceae archaeon]